MIDKNIVREIVGEYLEGTDMYLVDIIVNPGNTIIVEFDRNTGINIDDCVALSKHIESKLDRDAEDFELEVGSASITQPFKVLKQYQKHLGDDVELLTKEGKKLYGVLKEADEDKIVVTIEKQVKPEGAKRKITVEEDLTFTYNELKYTKYRF